MLISVEIVRITGWSINYNFSVKFNRHEKHCINQALWVFVLQRRNFQSLSRWVRNGCWLQFQLTDNLDFKVAQIFSAGLVYGQVNFKINFEIIFTPAFQPPWEWIGCFLGVESHNNVTAFTLIVSLGQTLILARKCSLNRSSHFAADLETENNKNSTKTPLSCFLFFIKFISCLFFNFMSFKKGENNRIIALIT